ncbi:hypothetical protein Scep_017302 [Stephania cephalantha]|uniref:Uncharacterized protein n=1 Tax=Stephania cephalantha TaxID=152367 RepID=A0AAP0IPB9_9MAGN
MCLRFSTPSPCSIKSQQISNLTRTTYIPRFPPTPSQLFLRGQTKPYSYHPNSFIPSISLYV